jgi:AraC-like DNA-binding protein
MPRTTTHYLRVLADQARNLELDIDRILLETGIDPELARTDDEFVDNEFLTALVKRLWRETGDECFGFDAEPLRLGSWGLACEFMAAGENLGELLRKGERLLSYLPAGPASMETSRGGDSVDLYLNIRPSARDPEHFLTEFMGIVWHRFPSWAIDETIQLQHAFFSYPAPAHAPFYDELFPCEIEFNCERSGFSFSRNYLKKPVVRSQREVQEWLRDSPANLIYLPGRDSSIQSQIRLMLNRELEATRRFPAFDRICHSLALSPAAVRRRLAEEGTSYQQIKDLVRQDVAIQLLAVPEMLITDIAERAGFADPAPFSRTFKKWTGMSPAQYREEKLGR